MNYLGYPISENFHYGDPSSNAVVRMARRSQACFNILALLDANVAPSQFDVRRFIHDAHLMRKRHRFDTLFEMIFESLGYSDRSGLTLQELSLMRSPDVLRQQMLYSESLHASPLLCASMRKHLFDDPRGMELAMIAVKEQRHVQ